MATRLAEVRETGVNTFVCLQNELPPQVRMVLPPIAKPCYPHPLLSPPATHRPAKDAPWPEGGVEKKSTRAKWAKFPFQNYGKHAGSGASFGSLKLL